MQILILSARYGLIGLNHVIPLYDQRMTREQWRDSLWVEACVSDAWHYYTEWGLVEVGHVYPAWSKPYAAVLRAGLAPSGIQPRDVWQLYQPGRYATQGRRQWALSCFLADHHAAK